MAINIFNALKKKAKQAPPLPNKVFRHPLYFLGFGLGSGAIPIAPGTFGTLMAIPFYLLLQPLSLLAYVLFVCCFCLASAYLCDYLSREIHIHDHPGMCIDEFAGFFVTMIAAPTGWQWILLGFILFRFFDILKPWPISTIDAKMTGGAGMVLDDVVAGLFACAVIQMIAYWVQ